MKHLMIAITAMAVLLGAYSPPAVADVDDRKEAKRAFNKLEKTAAKQIRFTNEGITISTKPRMGSVRKVEFDIGDTDNTNYGSFGYWMDENSRRFGAFVHDREFGGMNRNKDRYRFLYWGPELGTATYTGSAAGLYSRKFHGPVPGYEFLAADGRWDREGSIINGTFAGTANLTVQIYGLHGPAPLIHGNIEDISVNGILSTKQGQISDYNSGPGFEDLSVRLGQARIEDDGTFRSVKGEGNGWYSGAHISDDSWKSGVINGRKEGQWAGAVTAERDSDGWPVGIAGVFGGEFYSGISTTVMVGAFHTTRESTPE